ncbi:MAG: tRNA dihydrouridine(20/20a) synthase DusA [Pseudomonadales bacterium]
MQTSNSSVRHKFCVAPMMDLTDRHDRYLLRLLSRHALLYTEMITAEALLRGDPRWLLAFHPAEHPLALQLGGSDPTKLAACATLAQQHGFDEVNLNVGCPSDRVKSGSFGACLMLNADLVAECFAAMQAVIDIPVTIKCRIGVDQQEPQTALPAFIETVADSGCRCFIIHARKAWLQGLSPRQNREIPPLDYATVYRMKTLFPELEIVINGGIATLDAATQHLVHVDGVMLGRTAYYDPYLLADVDNQMFDTANERPSREQVFAAYLNYVEQQLRAGTALKHTAKHVLGLFHGQPGARRFRRHISENVHKDNASIQILEDAYALVGTG